MGSWRNKKKIKVAFFTVNFDYQAADFLPVQYDAVGFAAVNGLPNRIPRNDLSIFLEVVISKTEFFHCAIIKGFLIIRNKLFSITTFKRKQLYNIPGESMSLGDIDRAMEGLGQQFNDLLREAADANNADSYTAQFQSISTAMAEFKRRKAKILQIRQEQEQTNRRVQAVAAVLKTASSELTEWDDNVIYQLLEKVTVLSRERIRVTLRDGLEIEQAVEQPKRRKFT